MDYGVRRFDWIALDAMSAALIDAVVAGEDRRFWTHSRRGLAGDHRRAARDNLTGEQRRGASTITMQLATLLDSTSTPRAPPRLVRKIRAGACRTRHRIALD